MGARRAPQRPACTPRLVLVAALLGLVASLDWRMASSLNPFEKCMEDPDYEQLLKVVTLGLNRTLKPQKVVIVGAGVAGLTAAKVLSDAGHKALKYLKVMGCKKAMKKFHRHTLLEYLTGEGNLTWPAVQLLGDVMSKEGFFYLSFAEALRAHSCLSDRLRYSRIVGGWDLLPRALLSSLSGPVLLNAPVVAITQGIHDVRVHIATSLQPHSLKSMTADLVLLTASGPALQRMTFSPPLTRRRQEALRGLHYVAATKVFLSFHRPFWNEEHIEGGHSNTDRPARLIFYPAPGEGALLLASYTWSDAAAPFAGLSTEQALHVALKDVAALHGPVVYRLWDGTGVVKHWAEDPHSQGGFVVQPPLLGQGNEDYDWAFPYGRIYFAGEHTAYPHGWVETAVKSALRAAVKINNHGFRLEKLKHASFQKQGHIHSETRLDQDEAGLNEEQETRPGGHVFVEAIPELRGHVYVETIPQGKGHVHLHPKIVPPHVHMHEELIPGRRVQMHGGHRHGTSGSQKFPHLHSYCKASRVIPPPIRSPLEQATHSNSLQ